MGVYWVLFCRRTLLYCWCVQLYCLALLYCFWELSESLHQVRIKAMSLYKRGHHNMPTWSIPSALLVLLKAFFGKCQTMMGLFSLMAWADKIWVLVASFSNNGKSVK